MKTIETKNDNVKIVVKRIKNNSNEKILKKLTEEIMANAIITFSPKISKVGYAYMWITSRSGNVRKEFSLYMNTEIDAFIQAYLQGEDLPKVKNTTERITEEFENEWCDHIKKTYADIAVKTYDLEIDSADGHKTYEQTIYEFNHGRILFPLVDVTSTKDAFEK